MQIALHSLFSRLILASDCRETSRTIPVPYVDLWLTAIPRYKIHFLGNPNLNKIRTYCRKQRKIKHCAAI
jgi:hypothetical protein